ncbi:hypothetical protein BRM52_15515 [Xanthomonas oryzae pv. oryzae]|nr:hypothetical protein BRM52_15515 [Xanthomonas oryzae pv. oryzae]
MGGSRFCMRQPGGGQARRCRVLRFDSSTTAPARGWPCVTDDSATITTALREIHRAVQHDVSVRKQPGALCSARSSCWPLCPGNYAALQRDVPNLVALASNALIVRFPHRTIVAPRVGSGTPCAGAMRGTSATC